MASRYVGVGAKSKISQTEDPIHLVSFVMTGVIFAVRNNFIHSTLVIFQLRQHEKCLYLH